MSDEGVGGAVIGNRLPFEAVFVTEYPKMVALAAAVSGRRDQAGDIAQETLR
ncbi:MAG: hypothetical protein GY745_01175 [Actinomycetia bacterium]|nr:hypothetical protein [Actinomycetes bacterium]MCP3912968.1 hypothetical protein [Actinomycetes bacterium]MCP4083660.1 hypothetical protein [Actinomycetes bacterium]